MTEKIVYVVWLDACRSRKEPPKDFVELHEVGFLVSEDDAKIIIANEHYGNEYEYYSLIPKAMITKRQELTIKDIPKDILTRTKTSN